MEIILLRRVEKLGQMGEIVKVAPGFFRNFLFPRGFADRATKDRIAQFEEQKAVIEAQNIKERQEAEKIAARMEGTTLNFIRSAGETGHLYGSIRTSDVVAAMADAKFDVSRNQIVIETPIKTLGVHTVYLVLHPEVKMPLTLNIALSEAEADAQLKAYKNERPETEEVKID